MLGNPAMFDGSNHEKKRYSIVKLFKAMSMLEKMKTFKEEDPELHS